MRFADFFLKKFVRLFIFIRRVTFVMLVYKMPLRKIKKVCRFSILVRTGSFWFWPSEAFRAFRMCVPRKLNVRIRVISDGVWLASRQDTSRIRNIFQCFSQIWRNISESLCSGIRHAGNRRVRRSMPAHPFGLLARRCLLQPTLINTGVINRNTPRYDNNMT